MRIGIIILMFFIPQFALADCIIKVGIEDFFPQSYLDDSGNWQGMSIELAEVLLDTINCTPLYINTPRKRSIRLMMNGGIDMLLNVSMTRERARSMYFIGPQQDETIVLGVHKHSDFTINSLDDLSKLGGFISIQRGAHYGDEFSRKFEEEPRFANNFVVVNGNKDKIKLTNHGRTIAFFEEYYQLRHAIDINPEFENIKIHPFVINEDAVYFAFSKKSVTPELYLKLILGFEEAKKMEGFINVINRYK